MENYQTGITLQLLKEVGVNKNNFALELSERHEISSKYDMSTIMRHYRDEEFTMAIDDFGMGYSGYKLLYDATPDIIKIDRFFLGQIENDYKKKILVKNIVYLATQLGIKIIAEGVETKEELLVCRNLGCLLAQGYLIQKPTKNTDEILSLYKEVNSIIKTDKRAIECGNTTEFFIESIEPIHINAKIKETLSRFQKSDKLTVIPIINSSSEPVGIIEEKNVKNYLYSPYGISVLSNKDCENGEIKHHLKACGMVDISCSISNIIELFAYNPDAGGIIITRDSKYIGFLSSKSIISIMNKQNIFLAREQNPLTKLPGNSSIEKYMFKSLEDKEAYLFCYFDLDNFKPFNDVYGFRNGDRVILLFADLIRKHLSTEYFKGHIGGDDFFVGVELKNKERESIRQIVDIIERFSHEVKSFYDIKDRDKGYIASKNREGKIKNFPLLTVSASVIIVPKKYKKTNLNSLNMILSTQKKVAKCDAKHIAISCLYDI